MASPPYAWPPTGGKQGRGPTCARTKPSYRCWRSCSEACTSCDGAAGESLLCAWLCKPSAREREWSRKGRQEIQGTSCIAETLYTGPGSGVPCYSKRTMKPDKRRVAAHIPAWHSILLRAAYCIWLTTEYSEQRFPSSLLSLGLTPKSLQWVHLKRVEGVGTLDGSDHWKGALGGKSFAPREHARGTGDADGRCHVRCKKSTRCRGGQGTTSLSSRRSCRARGRQRDMHAAVETTQHDLRALAPAPTPHDAGPRELVVANGVDVRKRLVPLSRGTR